MKKIIALLLCLALVTCFLAGCGKNEPTGDNTPSSSNTTSTVKIKSDLKNGKIPELPLTLGCSVDGACATLNALENLPEGVTVDPDYTYYSTKISGDTVRLSCEGNFYYYNESNSQKGISAMVTFSDAFGFKVGIEMPSDIVNAIPQKGTTYSPTAETGAVQ